MDREDGMDYVDWVDRVFKGIELATSSTSAQGLHGVTIAEVGSALKFTDQELDQGLYQGAYYAIKTAVDDLRSLDLVELSDQRRKHSFALTTRGRDMISRGLSSLWANAWPSTPNSQATLSEDQLNVLKVLARMCQVDRGKHVYIEKQHYKMVKYTPFDRRWEPASDSQVYELIRQLMYKEFVEMSGPSVLEYARPTYMGFVRATRDKPQAYPTDVAGDGVEASGGLYTQVGTGGRSPIGSEGPRVGEYRREGSDREREEREASLVLRRGASQPRPQQRNQVFICYADKDRKWLEALQTALAPYIRHGTIELWSDQSIKAGEKWREQIAAALTRAKAAVLLVSQNFLASPWINESELPPLLEAAEKEGLIILWIAVSASSYKVTPIEQYRAVNNPDRPLNEIPSTKRDRELLEISERIVQTMNRTTRGG
jgi:hypothetical protein